MDFEVRLKLYILREILELCFAKLLIKRKFLHLFLQQALVFWFDDWPKNVHDLKDTHLKKHVEKVVVALKKSEHDIFIQVIVECLLFNSSINDILRVIFSLYFMADFEVLTSENQFQANFIFEEVVGSGEFVLIVLDLGYFKTYIAREIESS